MPTLAQILGGIDSTVTPAKRRLADLLRNPLAYTQQAFGQVGDNMAQFSQNALRAQEGQQLGVLNSVMADAPQYRNALSSTINGLLGMAPVGAIDKAALSAKYPNVDFSLLQRDNKATLAKVVVPKAERGQGVGTAFMHDLTAAADADAAQLALSPASDFGGNKARLIEFYKRFGFVPNQGRNKDFTVSETMLREPK